MLRYTTNFQNMAKKESLEGERYHTYIFLFNSYDIDFLLYNVYCICCIVYIIQCIYCISNIPIYIDIYIYALYMLSFI